MYLQYYHLINTSYCLYNKFCFTYSFIFINKLCKEFLKKSCNDKYNCSELKLRNFIGVKEFRGEYKQ